MSKREKSQAEKRTKQSPEKSERHDAADGVDKNERMSLPGNYARGMSAVCVVAAIAGCLAIGYTFFPPFPFGVPGEWTWDRTKAVMWENIFVSVAVAGLFAAILWKLPQLLSGATRRQVALLLGLIAVLSVAMHWGTMASGSGGIGEGAFVIAWEKAGSYYERSTRIESVGDYLREYPKELRLKGRALHLAVHPPGPVLFFWIFSASAEKWPAPFEWVARLMPKIMTGGRIFEVLKGEGLRLKSLRQEGAVWVSLFFMNLFVALTVLPVFGAARIFAEREGAICAAIFASVIPALHSFHSLIDVLFAPLAATVVFCWAYATDRRSKIWAFVAGVVFWGALLMSLSFLILGPSLIVILLSQVGRQTMAWRERLRSAIVLTAMAGLGFLAGTALLEWTTGYPTVTVWLRILHNNAFFNRGTGRSYWAWIPWNIVDFAYFLGVPSFVFLVGALLKGEKVQRYLAGAVLGTIAVMLVLGVNRGEVGRLWIPLMPLAIVAACSWPGRLAETSAGRAIPFLVQFLQVVAARFCLDCLGIW